MPTLQFLPSIRDSETVTCRRCNTRQYPKNGNCVRCHCSLGVDYLNFSIGALLDPRLESYEKQLARWIGVLLRSLRKRRGFANRSWHRCHLESTAVTSPKQNAGLRFFP